MKKINSTPTKTCGRCELVKPLTREFFGRRPNSLDGFNGVCRLCKNAAINRSNATRREEVNHRQKVYRYNLPFEKLEEIRKRSKLWYKDNRDEARARARNRLIKIRCEMIAAYGGECACCKESIPDFLTLDHTENNGAAHRREIGGSQSVLVHLRNLGWPLEGYRLLCYNCNCGRERNGGVCPHVDTSGKNRGRVSTKTIRVADTVRA